MKDENENPWGPNKGVPKDQEWLKLTKILYFSNFSPIQITQTTNCHYFYADLMQGEYNRINKRMWTPGGIHSGVLNGPEWPKLTKISFFGSYSTHLVNKFPFLLNWSNVGREVENYRGEWQRWGALSRGPEWPKMVRQGFRITLLQCGADKSYHSSIHHNSAISYSIFDFLICIISCFKNASD